MKKLLLIDNYDSFTYNLVQCFVALGVEVVVKKNDQITVEEALLLQPNYLVFSPGPGKAENSDDIGCGKDLFEAFRGGIPVLGVCMGHQMIGALLGGRIILVKPVHGKCSIIETDTESLLFRGLDQEMSVMRYHSMVIDDLSLPDSCKITAKTVDGLLMAFEKSDEKIYGIQFHPESIGTKEGMRILQNFLLS